ncbi:MAG: rane protein, partial [Deltaproteobacteria bacterium]|nr:rane protein [Deltaproteobacteria bacterium]
MSAAPGTARAVACASCHDCGLLARVPEASGKHGLCPRCGAELHERKLRSLERTLALVIAAFVCYVPANVLPVMTVTSLGKTQSD